MKANREENKLWLMIQSGLQPIGGQSKAGNAPQMWSYKSADAIADINTSGYFNDASDVLKVGDLIHVWDSSVLLHLL